MGLPSLLPALKKTGTSRSFLALDIGDTTIVSALWHVDHGKLVVRLVSDPVEWSDEDGGFGLPEAADVAIGELGEGAEKVDEVLLGLPETWTSKGLIIPDRKKQLKSLRDMLGLKLLGFAVSSEALVKYIALLDGFPLAAVIVQLEAASLRILVVHEGVITRTEVVGRSNDFAGDMTEALARVKEANPSPRILMFGMKFSVEELQALEQQLHQKDWVKGGFFHKAPSVESLPNDVLVTAVCLTAGREVAAGMGLMDGGAVQAAAQAPPPKPKAPSAAQEPAVPSHPAKEAVKVPPMKEKPVVAEPAKHVPADEENFGFVEIKPQAKSAAEPIVESGEPDQPAIHIQQPGYYPDETSTEEIVPEEKLGSETDGIGARIRGIFKRASYGSSLTERHAAEATGKKPVGFLIAFLVLLVVGAAAASIYFLKQTYTARVVILPKMEEISKEVKLTLSPTAETSNAAAMLVKVTDASETTSGKKEGRSTGKKIVGDKAKGKVTIFNRTMNEKSFPAKTLLTYKDMKFYTDEVVTVSGATTESGYKTVPGQKDVNVTAAVIGADSNLEKSMELTIANFDKLQYVASVLNPFTGGSSREILAVSEADVKRVQEELAKELQAEVISAMQKKAEGGKSVVAAGKPVVQKVTVEPEVGQESNTFEVSVTMIAKGIVYSSDDLLPVAKTSLQEMVPEKSVLRPEKTTLSVLNASPSANGDVVADVQLTSEVIPFIDREALAASIQGLAPDQAKKVLLENALVREATVQLSPSFVSMLVKELPSAVDRIRIEVHLGAP